MDLQQPKGSSLWRSVAGLAALGFGAVVAFFLVTEHRAHLYGVLPYLLVLACPLMMLFMHHGHDHHDRAPGDSEASGPPRETRP
jgi:peptidoglycan/LPS O-acetylase OafA/YrhL